MGMLGGTSKNNACKARARDIRNTNVVEELPY